MPKGKQVITLIYGLDDYQKSKRLMEIKNLFGQNDFNVSYFEENLDFTQIKSDAETLPFLSEKKLVIVKGISKIKIKKVQEDIISWLKDSPRNCDLVLLEDDLTPKNWLLSNIKDIGEIESFNKLKSYEISRWIKDTVEKKGGNIESIATEKLATLIGNDLWRLNNEIQKLLTYDKKVTLESVNNLVEGEFLDSIFVLMDAISEKKIQIALATLNNFLGEQDKEIYLLTMLARQIRNLMSIKELTEQHKPEGEIASSLKLHPYVVKNTLRQSRNFTINQLLELHQSLVEMDYNLKTSTTDSKTALARFVYQACEN